MAIEFDPVKDARNREKHGISLARVDELTDRIAIYSPRHGENRWAVIGRLDGQLYTAIITRRGANTRAISLRRARAREEKDHAHATTK
jgi:uncharacterized protein